ncbi:MAG: HAD family hydrolase [Breznakia sp.]
MIKNIIFDIGNVLLDFSPAVYFKDIVGADEICEYIFHSTYWQQHDLGQMSLSQVKEHLICERQEYQLQIEEILSRWTEVLMQKKTVQHIAFLADKGYRIYLLSNLAKDATEYVQEKYGFFQEVDGYVVSYKEHCIKPDPKIYQILLERYHLVPQECIFLDDLKENIHAAKQLGIYGIQVIDEDEALKRLYKMIEEDIHVK